MSLPWHVYNFQSRRQLKSWQQWAVLEVRYRESGHSHPTKSAAELKTAFKSPQSLTGVCSMNSTFHCPTYPTAKPYLVSRSSTFSVELWRGVALSSLQKNKQPAGEGTAAERTTSSPPMLWRRISWTFAILYVVRVHHNKIKTVHLNRIKLHAFTWSLCFLRQYTSQPKYNSTFIFSDHLGKYFKIRILQLTLFLLSGLFFFNLWHLY